MSSKYALIIATTEYFDSSLGQLSAPGKDAEDFAAVLKDKQIADFDEVKTLLNHPEADVREAIDEFFDRKKSDDMLLLYFSGHGVRDEMGALYLALKNTNLARLRATGVKSDFIREAMDHSFSKRQILILDCCNSGAFSHGTKATIGGSMGTATAFKGNGYGRVILTASDATQLAWEGNRFIGETQNSLFTHYLIQGLRGEADRDDDGKISVDDLYDYAYEQIIITNPKQTPGKWSFNQKGEIILCKHERIQPVVPPSILPLDLIASLEDPRDWVREAAMMRLEKILKGTDEEASVAAHELLEKIAGEGNVKDVSLMAGNILEAMKKSLTAPDAPVAEILSQETASRAVVDTPLTEAVIQTTNTETIKMDAVQDIFENQTPLEEVETFTSSKTEPEYTISLPQANTVTPLTTTPQIKTKNTAPRKAINFKAFAGVGLFAIISVFVISLALQNNTVNQVTPSASAQPIKQTEVSISTEAPAIASPTEEFSTATPTVEATTSSQPLGIGSTMLGKDGADLVYVPAGTFTMGVRPKDALEVCKTNHADCQLSWFNDEQLEHDVTLSAFWVDKTEVTNKQYRTCVEEGGCAPLVDTDSYRRPNYATDPAYDNFPVIYIDWNAANTYCQWAGRRLPTEAEWEKAARGTDGYPYPWGDETPNNDMLNYNSSVGDTTEVGSYPDGKSKYGAYDMAGNLWEWVGDWYAETYYYNSPSENPLGPETGSFRIARGGAWNSGHNDIRTSNRNKYAPDSAFIYVGFRCALSAP